MMILHSSSRVASQGRKPRLAGVAGEPTEIDLVPAQGELMYCLSLGTFDIDTKQTGPQTRSVYLGCSLWS